MLYFSSISRSDRCCRYFKNLKILFYLPIKFIRYYFHDRCCRCFKNKKKCTPLFWLPIHDCIFMFASQDRCCRPSPANFASTAWGFVRMLREPSWFWMPRILTTKSSTSTSRRSRNGWPPRALMVTFQISDNKLHRILNLHIIMYV